MRCENVWLGVYPSYWDINNWAKLIGDQLVTVTKKDNKRQIVFKNLYEKVNLKEIRTVCNSIIGLHGELLFLCKVNDARSHLQISNITCYNTKTRMNVWFIDQKVLVEKYKIPSINHYKFPHYNIGTFKINLLNGELQERSFTCNFRKIEIVPKKYLSQRNGYILCEDNEGNIKWTLENYLINWFQGCHNDCAYFINNKNELVILDLETGNKTETIYLENIRMLKRGSVGCFDLKNDLSFNNTSLFDVGITGKYVTWIDEVNYLNIYRLKKNTKLRIKLSNENNEVDFFISDINEKYVLINVINDEKNGSLVAYRMEDEE